ncbi:MAG TPA: hypothetical protein DIU15_02715 [Deltaproteobacteria bacterium]|nr:hypothetical protein [Deltaproteobacteria bacterium]
MGSGIVGWGSSFGVKSRRCCWRGWAVALSVLLIGAACSQDVSGPPPEDDPGADDGSSASNDCEGATGAAQDDRCFLSVSSGGAHACAIAGSGSVLCWGDDAVGQSTPPTGSFTQVSAGLRHSCAIAEDGSLQCWGAGAGEADGLCGFVDDIWYEDCGQASPPSGTFIHVSAGGWHSCAVSSAGDVQCWGADNGMEEDRGQVTGRPTGTGFVEVAAGWRHSCGLEASGEVQCWGHDNYGQSSPPSGPFRQLSAGGWHTCGLQEDDALRCWGVDNGAGEDWGQVGDIAAGVTAAQVTASAWTTCVLGEEGDVQCWGADWAGQSTPPALEFVAVSAGHNHTCAIDSVKALHCWGNDGSGQVTPP